MIIFSLFACVHDDRRSSIDQLFQTPQDESASRKKLLQHSIKFTGVHAIEPLIKYLNGKDLEQRILASHLLEQLSPLATNQIPHLLHALNDSEAQVRQNIHKALELMGEIPKKHLTEEIVKKHANESIEAQRVLFKLLSAKYGEEPAHMFMKLITNKKIKSVEQAIISALHQPDQKLYRLAIEYLPLYQSIWRQAEPLVYTALDSNDEWLISSAIEFLSAAHSQKDKFYDYLVEQASVYPNRYVKTATFRAMRKLEKNTESLQGFIELAENSNPYIRSHSLRAMFSDNLGGKIPIKKLRQWLQDPARKSVEKAYIYMMLSKHRTLLNPMLPDLLKIINDQKLLTPIKQKLILELPIANKPPMINFLKTLMVHKNDGVAVTAFVRYSELKSIPDNTFVKTLQPYLKHKNSDVVNIATVALTRLGKKAKKTVPDLVRVLLQNTTSNEQIDKNQIKLVVLALSTIQAKSPPVNQYQFVED